MSDPAKLATALKALSQQLDAAQAQIGARFIGQKNVVVQSLSAVLAGGHCLLVGVPGLGKTRLVDTLATVCGLKMSRVQFTPDLMPSDILGSELLDQDDAGKRHFRYVKGPIFCELFMADEINRASPRTQSALLQAMQERQVSIAGATHNLAKPFHVLATQNPIEQEGTYPLPEAQLDRFLLQVVVGYPDFETERDIILSTTGTTDADVHSIFDAESLIAAQELIRQMPIGQDLMDDILRLVRACRPNSAESHSLANEHFSWGPGPRAAQAFASGIRAHAALQGRFAPTWADVVALAPSVLMHRVSLRFASQASGVQVVDVINAILQDIKAAGKGAGRAA